MLAIVKCPYSLLLPTKHRGNVISIMADGTVDVDCILKQAKDRYKTIEVNKDIELQLDIGNLLVTDIQPIDQKDIR